MSAFKVYGVSFRKILAKVRSEEKVEEMTESQFEAHCLGVAKEKYKKAKPAAISSAYDAPQFCRDFIALCDREKFRGLCIRSYQATGKFHLKGKKQGLPKFGWRPHKIDC